MGLYPPENSASTGTMTRIVTKASKAVSTGAMEQSKAHKIFLHFFADMFISISIYIIHITLNVNSNG